MAHVVHDTGFASIDVTAGVARRKFSGIGKNGCYPGSFPLGKFVGVFAVPESRGGLGAINSVPHFYTVQIDFHNAFLTPENLDQNREVGFQAFPDVASALPEKHVFRRLLGDGTSSPYFLAFLVALERLLHRIEVEAVMGQKRSIFTGDDSFLKMRGNVLDGFPVMGKINFSAVSRVFEEANGHQRSEGNRNKPEENDQKNGNRQEPERHFFYKPKDFF